MAVVLWHLPLLRLIYDEFTYLLRKEDCAVGLIECPTVPPSCHIRLPLSYDGKAMSEQYVIAAFFVADCFFRG